MEKQGTKYKVFVVVLLCATLCLLDVKATEEFPTAGYDIVISSRQKHINSSGILFSKVGTSLVLDCSISNKSVQIEWKTSKDIHGTSIRLQNTSVIQYKIDKVTWNMNGSILWCRPAISMHGIDGVKATVIVGDIPSPPRDFSSSIYDVNLYIVRLSWKPALYTGGLPAYYKISYYQCYNKTYIPSHPEYNFCRTSHISGRKDYSCSMKRDDMVNLPIKSEQLCEIFHVTLVTVNNIGVSDAVNMSLYLGYGGETPFMPTPLPPSHLQAEAQGNYITVRWKTKEYYQELIDPTYIILYHAEKDTKNKTKKVKNQKMVTLRDGIKPYTKYYIYLMVEVSQGDRSQTSEAIGPVTTTTDEGEPKQGPSISGINNIVHDNDNTVRDVALQWEFKEPMVSSWQGKPANITVHYRNIAKQSTYEKITLPASQEVPRNVTLTGLNSDNDYQAYTTLCNTKHCGGMGPQTLVKSLAGPDPSNEKNTGENDHLALAVSLGVCGLVLLIIVAVGMIIKYRNRSTRTGAQPLHEIVPPDQLHPHHGNDYEYLADKVTVNEYTSANQL